MNLKEWRLAHNLTQSQLSRLMDIEPLTISRWERGVTAPYSNRFLELALKGLEVELAAPAATGKEE